MSTDPLNLVAGQPSRREVLTQAVVIGALGCSLGEADASPTPPPSAVLETSLTLNGNWLHIRAEARVMLLDALRERLGLPGAKKGCDHGQCGACTVLVNGRRVLSCLTFLAAVDGAQVTTIEGLARDGKLHKIQAAFIEHDAFQCGFCTPGQILSAVGMLNEPWPSTRQAIQEAMSGNLCRCGAYHGIVSALEHVRSGDDKP